MDRPVSLLEMWKVRQETIEECAKVCEPYYELEPRQSIVAAKIATAIRALKDKP